MQSSDQTPPDDHGADDAAEDAAPHDAAAEEPTRVHRPAAGAAGDDPTREHRPAPEADHDEPVREHRPTTGGGPTPEDPPPGLYRSRGDRMLFGVSGGIAERYGLEPLLIRLAFVATVFVGGAGILFYLAAALLVPAAPETAPGDRVPGPAVGAANGVLRVLVGIAAAIGILAALGAVAGVSLGATAFFGVWPMAVLLLVVAAALVVASTRSRAATGSLVLIALAVAVPATAAALSDLRVDRSFGDRTNRPGTVERAAEGYRLGFGELTVDLRETPFRRGRATRIPVRLDAGRLGVILPKDRCVAYTIRTRLTAGDVRVLDASSAADPFGTADRTVRVDPPTRAGDRRPRVTLDLRGRVGQIVVGYSRAAVRDVRRYDDVGRTNRAGVREVGDDTLRTSACRAADRERSRG